MNCACGVRQNCVTPAAGVGWRGRRGAGGLAPWGDASALWLQSAVAPARVWGGGVVSELSTGCVRWRGLARGDRRLARRAGEGGETAVLRRRGALLLRPALLFWGFGVLL